MQFQSPEYSSVNFITDRVSGKRNAIDRVRLFVRLFPLYLLNRLSFELKIVCMSVCVCMCGSCSWPYFALDWKLRSYVKVKGQYPACIKAWYNAVTWSMWPQSSIDDSFYSLNQKISYQNSQIQTDANTNTVFLLRRWQRKWPLAHYRQLAWKVSGESNESLAVFRMLYWITNAMQFICPCWRAGESALLLYVL